MYTIFFTINCVEQLIFYKTFVDHLQFEQLIFFWLKVKLIESSWFPKINRIRPVDKKSDICSNGVDQLIKLCRPVFSSNQILSSWSCPYLMFKFKIIYHHFFPQKKFFLFSAFVLEVHKIFYHTRQRYQFEKV